ncbi:MAG: hypothetical protein JWM14_401 [Chitinophagaceae bacterium]|nr:hypothetical protein [Chitinophagaceae bacterium]
MPSITSLKGLEILHMIFSTSMLPLPGHTVVLTIYVFFNWIDMTFLYLS